MVVGTHGCGAGNVCRCLAHALLWSGCAWAVLGCCTHARVFVRMCLNVCKVGLL